VAHAVAGRAGRVRAGVFNGPHKSFQDFNNFKKPVPVVNTRPFLLAAALCAT